MKSTRTKMQDIIPKVMYDDTNEKPSVLTTFGS